MSNDTDPGTTIKAEKTITNNAYNILVLKNEDNSISMTFFILKIMIKTYIFLKK